jgi:hypothetical protein
MCVLNGIRDLVHWRTGQDWSNEFLFGLGQGGGFAYLRIKVADPPRQVYWGNAPTRQHEYLANLLGADHAAIENRSFKFAWGQACQALEAGSPPILGPLDMFYLPYYPHLYRQRHIPIHYILLVGYDERNAYVHDTDQDEVQTVPLDELELAWDVNVPAMGKRNRLMRMDVPAQLPPTGTLIRKAVADQCQTMLRPPVKMLGVPAMERVTGEIARWPAELGDEVAAACLRQVREYLNSPPDLSGDHLTAGRDRYIAFLQEAEPLASLDFAGAVALLRESMATIPLLHQAIVQGDLEQAAAAMRRIAEVEARAYTTLAQAVGNGQPPDQTEIKKEEQQK